MIALFLAAALAAPVGWRGDGTGVVVGATPPVTWSTSEHVCWKAALPGRGNAMPVVVGDRVFVTSEPTTLTAHDARDGHEVWRASLDVTFAFEGDARAEIAGRLARAAAEEKELAAARTAYSALQRDVRRSGGDPALTAQLQELGRKLTDLKARLDAVAPYRTSDDMAIIGYASPTPASDGQRIFALTGHGVLAAFSLDGKRLWTRWLGPAVRPMRGYDRGHAASPVVVDGTLVVPYGHLRGVDPATGRDRWVSPQTWADYGTPLPRVVGSVGVVATPDGKVIRARDGVVLAQGFPAIYNVGPVAQGDVVVWFGNTDDRSHGVVAAAVRLAPAGDGIKATTLWTRTIPEVGLVAGTPVMAGGRIFAVEGGGEVWSVDAGDGQVLANRHLGERTDDAIHPSPTIVGDRLYVFGHQGSAYVLALKPDGVWDVLATNPIEASRSTPWFQGRRLYVRGQRALWCFEG